jgi:hypothetical protein
MLKMSEDGELDVELEDPADVPCPVETLSPLPLISNIMK